MQKYTYLIVGGGIASDSAIQAIRKIDLEGTIGMISQEDHSPYERPPLTKTLWKGGDIEDIWRETGNLGVNLHLSRTAMTLYTAEKKVYDNQGQEYKYDKLLIATGCRPNILRNSTDDVIYFYTIDDFYKLRILAEKKTHFAVIGGGLIASELAASLTSLGKEVMMVFPERGLCSNLLPEKISRRLKKIFESKGVNILPEEKVKTVNKDGDEFVMITTSGLKLVNEVVVAGIGVTPNTKLANSAGIKLDNGIKANQFLETSITDVYTAGDVVSFAFPHFGDRRRYEHEVNANQMGRIAGMNMAGKHEPYEYIPHFSTQFFDIAIDAVGDVNSRYDHVVDWAQEKELQEGVIYYLLNGSVRGVILWNVWGKIEDAKALIKKEGIFNAQNLMGKIQG